tara:strand:- start:10817 stop:11329 length:513 start_codon:yes stop_codon:yes gene_type:complete
MSDAKHIWREEKITSPIDGSDKCFRIFSEPESTESYLCMTTGYSTTSEHKVGSTILNSELDRAPELVQVLQFYDEERDLVWLPSIMNIPGKGMIFPEGTLEKWGWSYAPIVLIPEDERENYPIPNKEGEFFDSKLDIENSEKFGNDEFHKALIKMGVITKDFKGSLMNGN